MSFNKNEIQTNQKITPLKEDKQNDFFILQSKFLNFIKTYEEISEYEVKLEKLSIKDYEKIKEDM